MQRMIRVEKCENFIQVRFPYNPDYIEKIKAVKNYRWWTDKKCWSIPYSELRNLLTVFDGERGEVDSPLEFIGSDEKND